MQIKEILYTHPVMSPYKTRMIEVANDLEIKIHHEFGVYVFKIKKGFKSDGRSGGKLVDFLIPHYGDEKTFISWLCHDVLFLLRDEGGLSFEKANELLYYMLEWAGYGVIKRKIVNFAVSSFIGRKEFDHIGDDDLINQNLASFEWVAK